MAQAFLNHPEQISISAFTDLLGRDGFVLSADGQNHYCSFDDGGGQNAAVLIQQEDTLHQVELNWFIHSAARRVRSGAHGSKRGGHWPLHLP